MGLHMAAQGPHLAGAIRFYGSHAADMQYMLHLAGVGWAARIPGDCPDGGNWALWAPYLTACGWRFKAEIYHNAGSRLKDAHEL